MTIIREGVCNRVITNYYLLLLGHIIIKNKYHMKCTTLYNKTKLLKYTYIYIKRKKQNH